MDCQGGEGIVQGQQEDWKQRLGWDKTSCLPDTTQHLFPLPLLFPTVPLHTSHGLEWGVEDGTYRAVSPHLLPMPRP